MSRFRQIKGLFRRGGASSGVTAVEYGADGIALAHLEMRFDQPSVSQCVFLPGAQASGGNGELKQIISSLGLSGGDCTLVLSPDAYRLLTIETPEVPAQELRDAVRWGIHESLDFPIEDAAVDSFPMPDSASRGGKQIFAVAAQRSRVEPLIKDLAACGMSVSCVDIAHLALRNLAARGVYAGQATALLALGARQSQLVVVKDGSLFLVRPIGFSGRVLARQGTEKEIAVSQLVGELKRSLDYFEIQLRQEPISSLQVIPYDGEVDEFVQSLATSIGTDVVQLSLQNIVPCEAALPASIQHHCANVVGGALNSLGGQ